MGRRPIYLTMPAMVDLTAMGWIIAGASCASTRCTGDEDPLGNGLIKKHKQGGHQGGIEGVRGDGAAA